MAHLKMKIFEQKNLNYIVQLHADDMSMTTYRFAYFVALLPGGRRPYGHYLPHLSLNIIIFCTNKKKMLPITLCHMLYHSELHLTLDARTLRLPLTQCFS